MALDQGSIISSAIPSPLQGWSGYNPAGITAWAYNNLASGFAEGTMDATLQGGSGDDVYSRAAIFNNAKQSRGMMIIDKEKEEFSNVNRPLSGLDELQAQALEHICSAIRQPVVKYTGIDPQGLNASSEGSIRVYYDLIHSTQEYLIRPPLQTVVDLVQIELFDDVDPDILLEFEARNRRWTSATRRS
jgi:hypothetical protein